MGLAFQRPNCSQNYLNAKLRQFGGLVLRRIDPSIPKENAKQIIEEAMYLMAQQDATAQPMRNLRLVIRHDCQ